jgi:hypothetical protein
MLKLLILWVALGLSFSSLAGVSITGGGEGFKLIKNVDNRGTMNLIIEYYGQLSACDPQKNRETDLKIYINLNGKDGLFKINMCQTYYSAEQDKHISFAKIALTPDQSDANTFEWKTLAKDLFWAAKDNNGNLNKWDLQLAVTNVKSGKWDSQAGSNYRFSL